MVKWLKMKTKLLRKLRKKAKRLVRIRWYDRYYGIGTKNSVYQILGSLQDLRKNLDGLKRRLERERKEFILDELTKMYARELKETIKKM